MGSKTTYHRSPTYSKKWCLNRREALFRRVRGLPRLAAAAGPTVGQLGRVCCEACGEACLDYRPCLLSGMRACLPNLNIKDFRCSVELVI
ncbi:hypothetical protein AXX17_ATUG03300 (mitochondrion) [Arabidopsis thaliana]|uniref:Uncharacterized protein n=1 Tax=Arabidopsis thaliana TaxID=3702 RepID=A0A178U6K1_ARATH|nr:hypothetical protein AXX17_ATUG03300 [Arabidopsis thaliana]